MITEEQKREHRDLAAAAKSFHGKRIKHIKLRKFNALIDGAGYSYEPLIEFDDGSRMSFVVDETDAVQTYGITPRFYTK